MLINTTNFGEIEIQSDKVIMFDQGLPGFEDQKEFVLVNNNDTEEPVPFMWLQATHDPSLALVVTIPFLLRPDFEMEIPEEVTKELDITDPGDVAVYSIVKIQDKVENMTFNLLGPIVVNGKNHKGKQVVQYNSKYRVDEWYKQI